MLLLHGGGGPGVHEQERGERLQALGFAFYAPDLFGELVSAGTLRTPLISAETPRTPSTDRARARAVIGALARDAPELRRRVLGALIRGVPRQHGQPARVRVRIVA